MDLADRIRARKLDLQLSQEEIANRAGISQGMVAKLINRKSETTSRIADLAKALECSVEWLSYGQEQFRIKEDAAVYNVSPAMQTDRYVPLVSWVQAGEFNEAIDIHATGYADEWVARINGGDSVYALRVRGHSMTAPIGSPHSFPEGMIIHVDPDQASKNGDFVIAKVNGEDGVTFKQLKHDDKPYLFALNPSYPPIFDEFRILGKVIGVSLKL